MVETLSPEALMERLEAYEGWSQQGGMLVKAYEFEDFSAAMDFVNQVAEVAEELNHHPDIVVQNYNEVMLSVTTHEANGITEQDLTFVDRVEALPD